MHFPEDLTAPDTYPSHLSEVIPANRAVHRREYPPAYKVSSSNQLLCPLRGFHKNSYPELEFWKPILQDMSSDFPDHRLLPEPRSDRADGAYRAVPAAPLQSQP